MNYSSLIYIFSILVLTSCATSNKYMADDVYVMKPNALPLGESSADETSYTAFKQRQEGRNTTQQVYANQMDQNRIMQCYRQPFWTRDCGCSYSQWVMGSPYSSMNQPAFGMYSHNPYNSMGNSSYWGHPSYGMNVSYGFGMNSGYYNYYNPYYAYHPYNSWNQPYYGYYNSGYGYGGNSNGWYGNNNAGWNGNNNYGNSQANHHNGPRGTSSGYANPSGRQYSGVVKSGTVNTNSNSGNREVVNTNGRIVNTKPIDNITTVPASRTVERAKVNGNMRENSSSVDRTYRSSTEVKRNPSSNVNVNRPAGNVGTSRSIGNEQISPNRPVFERSSGTRISNESSSPAQRPSASPSRGVGSSSPAPSRRP